MPETLAIKFPCVNTTPYWKNGKRKGCITFSNGIAFQLQHLKAEIKNETFGVPVVPLV